MAKSLGKRPAWVDGTLFPFESRFMAIGNHVVHYVDEGSGPILLMLHGNPTWSFVYAQAISRLREQFRCIALDYPGFGLSVAGRGYSYLPEEHAAAVGTFIDCLDLFEVTLVAQDWGGPIGLHAAAKAPARFGGLVIANTWAWPVNGDLHFEVFSRAMGGLVGRQLIERFNLFVNLMIPVGHRRRKLSESEMHHYRAPLPTPARRRASAVLPRAITHSRDFLADVASALEQLQNLPSLIVWADADVAFREQERHKWEALLSNSSTTILHGAGHYLQSDAPDDFATAISTWHDAVQAKGARKS